MKNLQKALLAATTLIIANGSFAQLGLGATNRASANAQGKVNTNVVNNVTSKAAAATTQATNKAAAATRNAVQKTTSVTTTAVNKAANASVNAATNASAQSAVS